MTVEVLRSSASRAVDIHADLLIIYGSGLPNFEQAPPFVMALNETGHGPFVVSDYATDDRLREVTQAAMRSASLEGGRRAVLIINDLTGLDLPKWMRHRIRPAAEEYRKLTNQGTAKKDQIGVLVQMVVEALSHGAMAAVEEILSWNGGRRSTNRTRWEAVLAAIRSGEELRPSRPTGSKAEWGKFLRWLEEHSVLMQVPTARGIAYTFTQAAKAIHNV